MAPVEAATLVLKAAYLFDHVSYNWECVDEQSYYLHCADGCIESRAPVESKPTEPDQDGAKEDQSSVVGLAVRLLALALTLSQYEGVCQTSPARGDMHRSASGEVKRRQVEEPSVCIPCPASNRAVDYSRPTESKYQAWQDATTFEGTTDHDLDGAGAEKQLVQAEDDFRNVGIAGRGRRRDVLQTEVGEVADEGRSCP